MFGIVWGKVYYTEAYMEISPQGNVEINYTIIPQNTTEIKILIENPGKFSLPEQCSFSEEIVSCTFSKSEKIKFSEISRVKSSGNRFEFGKNIRIFDYVEKSVFLVKLPEGAILPQNTTKFFPLYGTIGTDGRRIFVVWERNEIPEGEIQGIEIFYEFPKNKEKSKEFDILLVLLIILVSFAIAAFVLYRRRKSLKDIVLPVLKEDEKKIMEILLKYPKGVNQKVIVHESNYSKGKVSKVLKSLSERGLVRLERMGRTNMVYPILDFEKK